METSNRLPEDLCMHKNTTYSHFCFIIFKASCIETTSRIQELSNNHDKLGRHQATLQASDKGISIQNYFPGGEGIQKNWF